MKPRRLITLTMSSAGMLAGLAGTIDILGVTHQMPATYSTNVGFDAITVALLGRSNPFGIMLAALLFGIMRAGAGPMQIQAGVPARAGRSARGDHPASSWSAARSSAACSGCAA